MLEKEMFAKRDISKSNQIFDEWKFLPIQIPQPINKKEIIELKNHCSTIFNKFLYVAAYVYT